MELIVETRPGEYKMSSRGEEVRVAMLQTVSKTNEENEKEVRG